MTPRTPSFLIVLTLCSCIGFASFYPGAAAAETCAQWVAKVVSVQGQVESRRTGDTQWQAVKLNDTYCPGDTIRVQAKSRADISLVNRALLRLNQNSEITLGEVEKEQTFFMNLLKGAAHIFSRITRGFEVHTPYTVAGVRGTEFYISVEQDRTFLSVFEGKVWASNEAGSLALISGQSGVAQKGRAPVPEVVVRPRDAVQWAIYYPPIIEYHPADFPGGDATGWRARVRKSLGFYWQGDLTGAFSAIEGLPENIPDPRYFIYRAALLLTVGQVDEARTEIEGALSLDSKNGQAVALQSIIALVHNEKEKALNFARQAVAADPNSASARIALSYVQQAEFDLKGALTSVQEAVKLAPENALAWSRLAELRSSFGRLDESLKAARKAVALNPDLARTQMVLGFAYLTQVKTAESKQAFEKAIVLDQAAPLPRLGLGLAKIRDGDLDGGGREIEIAASLDPNNSLIRSYLGKLYYEEKRTKLDQREYAIAKELDPKDPTPWFYDAIAKQTSNRPVEALRDYQKSIELNDNRAVYRSKLLLDSDEAARQSALARIYSDLGFQQLALVEGWKSVNIDPTNFSAHRFLADSYSVLPRREIARVSELLQSQLLQPINITPIQPRLGESNLFLISAQGPAGLSSNEFNPIFNRNRVAAQGSGLAGGNDTYGGEGVLSGIYKKFSFSGGYNHFETDGWRKNADQNDDIANAFAQIELSYKTSIQAEYRYRDTHNGDLELRFFKDDFRPEFKEKEDTKTYRMGLRHGFSPSSIILASGIYQNRDTKLHDEPTVAFINSIDQEFKDQEAFSGELQHLFRSNYINLTSGLGYFDIDKDQKLTTELNLPPPPFGPGPITTVDKFDQDVNHLNLYLYSQIKPLSNLTFTLGASGDFFNTDSSSTEDKNQFNPKFGVSWNPYSGTTLRGAVFRTLKRTLITDQTLEPTQVAGFNQFFDDADATEAWTYGIGVNQKFTKAIYGGAEFFYRDLTVPFQVGSDVDNANWDEYQGRAYLFWTPHPWVSLSAEYYYERIEKEDFRPDVDQVTTYRVPLGLRLFHPSGLNAFVGPTYVHQDGDFLRRGAAAFESDDDDFWLVDAAINYRLPKRYGFISVGVTNLFDKKFNYQEFDLKNPSIQPDRSFVASITLAFP